MRPTSIIGLSAHRRWPRRPADGRLLVHQVGKVLDIGPLEATVQTKERVPLPPIAGGLAMAAGVALLLVGQKKKVVSANLKPRHA